MLEALLSRLNGEGFVGKFELTGEVLAYGTSAKKMFEEITGFWDESNSQKPDPFWSVKNLWLSVKLDFLSTIRRWRRS